MDIAPTVLEAVGVKRPKHIQAKGFLNLLTSGRSGFVEPARDHVFICRERYVGHAQKDRMPYASWAIRTADYLLIRNIKPD